MNTARRFAQWCEAHGIRELAAVEPAHIAAFIKQLQGQFAAPTVKQHLAALRMLFDWLVIGHVIDVNPVHAGGAASARTAAGFPGARTRRIADHALIAVMVYSFARINAVLEMKVRDYFVYGWRAWVRLHDVCVKIIETVTVRQLKT
jgi:integrase/recombinase XerD